MNLKKIIGDMMDILLSNINQDELNQWADMELDHTDGDRQAAKKIVGQHIKEYGLNYYPKYIDFVKQFKKPSV